MGDRYCIQNINNNLYSVTNKEMNVDIQIKIEEVEHFETDLIVLDPEYEEQSKTFNEGADLYHNHEIKEELVIGPEVIQENLIEVPLNTCKIIQNYKTVTYQCKKCNERFKTQQSLFIHSKDIHSVKICKFCNKIFYKTSNIKRHQNYSCPKNELVAKNNEILKYGVYTHRFICDYCKKSYSHKNTLVNHIKTHLGQPRTYQCKYCDKIYTKAHNLTCHIRSTHLKVKAYSCSYCKKRFYWRYGLTNHMKTIHKNCKSKS